MYYGNIQIVMIFLELSIDRQVAAMQDMNSRFHVVQSIQISRPYYPAIASCDYCLIRSAAWLNSISGAM